jgi:hypothetical protein
LPQTLSHPWRLPITMYRDKEVPLWRVRKARELPVDVSVPGPPVGQEESHDIVLNKKLAIQMSHPPCE